MAKVGMNSAKIIMLKKQASRYRKCSRTLISTLKEESICPEESERCSRAGSVEGSRETMSRPLRMVSKDSAPSAAWKSTASHMEPRNRSCPAELKLDCTT